MRSTQPRRDVEPFSPGRKIGGGSSRNERHDATFRLALKGIISCSSALHSIARINYTACIIQRGRLNMCSKERLGQGLNFGSAFGSPLKSFDKAPTELAIRYHRAPYLFGPLTSCLPLRVSCCDSLHNYTIAEIGENIAPFYFRRRVPACNIVIPS